MIDPQEYFLQSADPISEKVAHIFEVYRQGAAQGERARLRRFAAGGGAGAEGLPSEVRERYNRRYRYLLIDEYQDTNRPQYELMKLLAGRAQECLRGGRRGSEHLLVARRGHSSNILEFEKDFPGAKTVRLEQNYRSTQIILEAASAVVARNAQRKGKRLWTSREGGSLIGYYEAPDGENEALFIADPIQKYLRKAGEERTTAKVRGAVPDQFAVAAGGRGDAAVRHRVHDGGRVFVLRARGD